MARSSGRSGLEAQPFGFTDPSTQARYRVSTTESGLMLHLDRPSSGLSGSRLLSYFIGSGRIGRSYIFSDGDGFLYQAPVSWYANDRAWRASPGFQRKERVDLTRPVEPSCLQCHASRVQHIAGTQNRYASEPFLQPGVSCERCHGAGREHVETMRSPAKARREGRAIVNPVKLDPERRDSVCAQCHLTGSARIARAQRGRATFKPGDRLSDHISVFVWPEARSGSLSVTSHFENLAHSRCKQASGDRLWCGTCHDPHGEGEYASQRIRQQCLNCHASRPCTLPAAARGVKADVCQACHMPQSDVRDVQHAAYTDHSIPRLPGEKKSGTATGQLVSFWRAAPDPRDLALAMAVVAMTEPAARRPALELLRKAEANDPKDAAVAGQLAQFYDRMGRQALALPLFERVRALDPANTAALINLGTIYAQQDRLPDAIEVWRQALAANPALTAARLNIAMAQLKQGDRAGAVATLRTALLLDPDSEALASPQVRGLLQSVP